MQADGLVFYEHALIILNLTVEAEIFLEDLSSVFFSLAVLINKVNSLTNF